MKQWPVDLSPEALAQWVGNHFEGTLMGLLGMQVIEVSKTRAVVDLPVHAGLTTPSGHIHAGSMVSLAATSATFAAMAVLQRASESTVVHPGRTLVAVTTRITADNSKLLALVNSSHFNRQ